MTDRIVYLDHAATTPMLPQAQAAVIEAYLPKRMSDGELEEAVVALVAELGVNDMKAMGRVIGEANKRLAGKADGAQIAALVKRLLSGG